MRNKHRRSGYSLVECLVVIALMAAALGSVGWTMHVLARSERKIQDSLSHERGLDALVASLRADAHQALDVVVQQAEGNERASRLVLNLPDEQRVEYSLGVQSAERLASQPAAATHRETYVLPAAPAGWVLEGQVPNAIVSLHWDPVAAAASPPPPIPLQAAVGILRSASPLPPEATP